MGSDEIALWPYWQKDTNEDCKNEIVGNFLLGTKVTDVIRKKEQVKRFMNCSSRPWISKDHGLGLSCRRRVSAGRITEYYILGQSNIHIVATCERAARRDIAFHMCR